MAKTKQQDDGGFKGKAELGKAAESELEKQRRYVEELRAGRGADLAAQRAFTDKLKASGIKFGLVMERAFANSIRALGYKSTMYALAELIDNSIQAGAENVHVIPYCEKAETMTEIAVLDDGHGMDPAMVQIACLWGGTHRENDRSGFGRFGFGGPSACASQGRRFTFYSAPAGGEVHSVTIDIDDISEGKLTGQDGLVVAPPPVPLKERPFPKWLKDEMAKRGFDPVRFVGTVVLIEKLDRLTYVRRTPLSNHLVEGFGVTYRNYLRQVNVTVGEIKIDPVDPMFTTRGYRGYDIDDDRAAPKEPIVIQVKAPDGQVLGKVRVRFSLMPPTFAAVDKSKGVGSRGQNANYRWNILKNYNKGICVLRKGRQVDTIEADCPWITFVNYDRYWSCELDFDPSLDEELSVTTAKQQVRLSERMWTILENNGVRRVIEQLKRDFRKMLATHETETDKTADKRQSEMAMEAARKYKRERPGGTTAEAREQAEQALQRDIKERAQQAKLPEPKVEEAVREEQKTHPYKIRVEDAPGAPFFRTEQVGQQVVLSLNRAHNFFTQVYAGTGTTPRSRAGLEVLLFVIADCVLDASGEQSRFYKVEVPEWSRRLEVVIDELAELRDPAEEDAPIGEEAASTA